MTRPSGNKKAGASQGPCKAMPSRKKLNPVLLPNQPPCSKQDVRFWKDVLRNLLPPEDDLNAQRAWMDR